MSPEQQIKSLNDEITELQSKTSSRSKRKIKELKKEEFELLEAILGVEDSEYQKLVKRNLELLSGEELKFIVYDIEDSRIGSYAKEMEGSLMDNGHLFYECSRTNIAVTDWEKHIYPKRFSGRIDALGRSHLEVSEKGFHFFICRLPELFTGTISKDGTIDIKLKKAGWEVFGTNYISKIVCDPFSANQEKKSEFVKNRNLILKKVKDLRVEILKMR